MEVGGKRHASAALPPGKSFGTHCTGGWVDHRAGLDGRGKSPHLIGIRSPDRPIRSESLSKYVILIEFHCNNGCKNAPQCYVIRTLTALWTVQIEVFYTCSGRCVKDISYTHANKYANYKIYTFPGKYSIYIFFSVALRPNAGHGLLILEVSISHTTTQHSR